MLCRYGSPSSPLSTYTPLQMRSIDRAEMPRNGANENFHGETTIPSSLRCRLAHGAIHVNYAAHRICTEIAAAHIPSLTHLSRMKMKKRFFLLIKSEINTSGCAPPNAGRERSFFHFLSFILGNCSRRQSTL